MSNHVLSRVFRAVKGLNPLGAMLFGVMLLFASPVQAETTILPLAQWVNADIGTTPVASRPAVLARILRWAREYNC